MNTEKTNHELNVLVAKACHMEWEGRKLYIKERGRRSRWCIRYGPSDNHCWLFNPAESIIIALELAFHHMPEGWWIEAGLKDPGHKIILKRSPISREDPGWEKWWPVNTLEEMARTITELWLEAMEAKTKPYTKCVRLDSE